jgi:hypothetical protein
MNRSREFSLFLGPVKFTSTPLVSSPPFSLPGATSPPADVTTPPRHVTLPFHGAKMRLLSLLHLLTMLHPVASPLELKLNHWICTIATGHPFRTARLPPSAAIICRLNFDHSHHHSTASPFYLIPIQSTMSSELHPSPIFPFIAVPRSLSLRTTIFTVMN